MRALVGGFPDDAEIVQGSARTESFGSTAAITFSVPSSLGGLQIGLERMDGGLIHVWYHHLLIGHLRVGPMVGRNVTSAAAHPVGGKCQRG